MATSDFPQSFFLHFNTLEVRFRQKFFIYIFVFYKYMVRRSLFLLFFANIYNCEFTVWSE